ncbi:MAG TPA: tellurite resistance TerB family protein [Kofleriaceae bacterium]|nr:tellurite resistance TerB family protein [Kofleriaceae bacterium]
MTIDDSTRHQIGAKVGLPAAIGDAANLLGHDDELGPDQQAALARLTAMLEVAFLAAAADGEINDAEADNLGATLATWLGTELSEETVEHVIARFMSAYEADGRDARLATAARVLDDDARRTAYTLACLVVLCDLELHDRELDVLGVIATGLELSQEEAQARFEQVQDHIETVVANARA